MLIHPDQTGFMKNRHVEPQLSQMGSPHQASHCSREPDRDAHSHHPFLRFLLNLSKQQYDKTVKLKKFWIPIHEKTFVCMQTMYYYTYRTLMCHYRKPPTSSIISPQFHTINWNKSTILPLSEDVWDSAARDSPLHTGNIKYLGIIISPRLSELFNLNYTPLLKNRRRLQTLDQTPTHSYGTNCYSQNENSITD